MEKEIELLKQKLGELENAIFDLRSMRDANTLQGKINAINAHSGQIDALAVKIGEVENFINLFCNDDKYIEYFTPEEMKRYYLGSDMSLPDVAGFLYKLTGNQWSNEQANDLVYSCKGDLRIISRLGKYLRAKSVKG